MLVLDIAVIVAAASAATSILWFTFKTGISPMPSSARACRAMLAAAASAPAGPIVDLGSGWGTLAIAFARRYPDRQVIGYELSWLPWLVSSLRKHVLGLRNLSLRREDFLRAELPAGAVLLCYLFVRGMQALAHKLRHDRGGPAMIISNTFALPSERPDEVIRLDDAYRTPIYVYRWRHSAPVAAAVLAELPSSVEPMEPGICRDTGQNDTHATDKGLGR